MNNPGWIDPLAVAESLSRQLPEGELWAFLYSGMVGDDNRHSLLAWGCEEQVRGEDFDAFSAALGKGGAWFGYLGYGLKNAVEILPQDQKGEFHLPALWMLRFKHVLRFDHREKKIAAISAPSGLKTKPHLPEPLTVLNNIHPAPGKQQDDIRVNNLSSNMSRKEYIDIVKQTIAHIEAGEFYQANITRKFRGEFKNAPDNFALFTALCQASPAPYSAFLHLGEATVISSSPECFLKIDSAGNVISRPIKGSAPRAADAAEDEKLRESLRHSGKDQAENLMIVDLMRNDLSRHCETGSVQVDRLFDIITYANVHHMVSTVRGKKSTGSSTLDVVKNCFPPGSMTGAPKIRAMQWCSAQEKLERGVYSGALGWFADDRSCDLSVVIRTLIVKGNRFEFQVGGGIVADSNPEAEWQETLAKARGIAAALGIEMKELEKL